MRQRLKQSCKNYMVRLQILCYMPDRKDDPQKHLFSSNQSLDLDVYE